MLSGNSLHLEVHERLVQSGEALLGVEDVVVAGRVGHEDDGRHVRRVGRPLRPSLTHVHLQREIVIRVGIYRGKGKKVSVSFGNGCIDFIVCLCVSSGSTCG